MNCVVDKSSEEPDASQVTRYARENGYFVRFIRKMDMAKGQRWSIEGGTGGDCRICNRLRLTSNGNLKPCLFNDLTFNVRELGIKHAIKQAVMHKPAYGIRSQNHQFYNIGG